MTNTAETRALRTELFGEVEERTETAAHDRKVESFEEWVKRLQPQRGVITKENWDVPIPSHNGYMQNKNVDYNLLGGVMLMSNFDGLQNKFERNRYIYSNNFNHEELQALCGIGRATLYRNFSKLRKTVPTKNAHKPLISVENTENGAVYKINYATEGKYFVTIPSDILKYLIKHIDKEEMRMYVFMKVQLANGSKQMQREFIADSLGMNKSSERQLKNVTKYTNTLVTNGLITKSSRIEFFWDEIHEREIPKTLVTYSLCTDEEVRQHLEL